MKASFSKYILKFKEAAKTSRDILWEKETYFLKVTDGEISGVGECAYLKGLSYDRLDNYEQKLASLCNNINHHSSQNLSDYPSIMFGLETALRDLNHGGKKIIFDNDFHKGKKQIPINGLIWMNDFPDMKKQINTKIEQGYDCIKVKIGQYNFEEELNFILKIRKEFPEIIIRLDANGALNIVEAKEKIDHLSEAKIHSIEQPIKAGNWEEMAKLCDSAAIDIALDEELIGITNINVREKLLDIINPPYIIIKPSLLGGFTSCDQWITLAEKRNIGWWATSALESNIGLNAIAQWLCEKEISHYQGLGTGMLYSNNILSPLTVENGFLIWDNKSYWGIC